jgi:hypothetical protein
MKSLINKPRRFFGMLTLPETGDPFAGVEPPLKPLVRQDVRIANRKGRLQ